MLELDEVKIHFDNSSLWILNIALAIVMFGVALGITPNDFKGIMRHPKLVLVGVLSQFVLLLKIKIKRAFPLLVYMRFLFSLSSP